MYLFYLKCWSWNSTHSHVGNGKLRSWSSPRCYYDTRMSGIWTLSQRESENGLKTHQASALTSSKLSSSSSTTSKTLRRQFTFMRWRINLLGHVCLLLHSVVAISTLAEFMRAVEISTGEKLSENLVRTVYAIFDKNGDQMVKLIVYEEQGSIFQSNYFCTTFFVQHR